jgi:hypothetical protein
MTLQPEEVVVGRPFTDVAHTQTDLAILRYLVAHLGLVLDSHGSMWVEADQSIQPLELHFPTPEQWWHRVIVTQAERLLVIRPLIIVGFFGQRRNGGDERLAHSLDGALLSELPAHDDLLAYSTLALPTGNFSNLVVFAREEGIGHWGRSQMHNEAVRILTPNYYLSVRLYRGIVPEGLEQTNGLRLTQVKYYDYQETPLWRAVRPLS